MPIDQVTDFYGDGDIFLEQVAGYLAPRGLLYIQVDPDDYVLKRMFGTGKTWHLIEGISERGGMHACVACNGKLVHDPHRGGHGLVKLVRYGLLAARLTI